MKNENSPQLSLRRGPESGCVKQKDYGLRRNDDSRNDDSRNDDSRNDDSRNDDNRNDGRVGERGNAMIYVLIALALFGALTFALSNQNNQADGQNIDDEVAELYTNELLEYVVSAQQVVDMMLASGSEVDDLSFVNPTSTGFDTGSHIHKVFHPQGGGLNYQKKFNEAISRRSDAGWYVQTGVNVIWTPTTGNDVILSALRIDKTICENINKKITGNITTPQLTTGLENIFDPGVTTDLDTISCPNCDGYPSLCVLNQAGDLYGFYSIIAAQ